ncbi:hypothetical protein [Ochrobactrum sp. Marseille-Q0166]|uniref:hypothetical protein n=1 Tax=Ochrobactrum sp. Marseille-Q0166 TaxID=2761105 RepID=UPI001655D5AD|nr:hypothetical protein [Ochrobactrum sp. Marseille-Q0166]MBC8717911.1 hypothetical protein [Ochrobactrum sp. Marseille-Q0166]
MISFGNSEIEFVKIVVIGLSVIAMLRAKAEEVQPFIQVSRDGRSLPSGEKNDDQSW